MATRTESLQITGMSCSHCVRGVREALERVEGLEVENAEIGSARVRYDDAQIPRDKLVEAIEEAGYNVVS